MENNQPYDILKLDKMSSEELDQVARDFNLDSTKWPRQTTIYSILNEQQKQLNNEKL